MSFSEKLSNSYLWEKRKLVEITKKIGSGATPRGGKGAYKERGIPFIRSQNIYNCKFNSDGLVYINDEQAVKLNNVKLEKNDVLINITGDSVARCTKLPNEFIDGRVNQHVAIIRCNEKFIDSDYLKYYLVNKETQMFLLSLAGSGATRAALTKSMLENIEISLPYIEEQKAISKILSDLDEKIEVNNKINKNLEEMAQAIFKQWFVDFEFPNEEGKPYKSSGGEMVESELGMIPKGWSINKISEISEIKNGVNYSRNQEGELVKVINVRDFNGSLIVNDNSLDNIYLQQKQIDDYKLKKFDTVIVRSAKPGETILVDNDEIKVYSGFTIRVRTKKQSNKLYIFYCLRNSMKKIENSSNGTIFKNLNQRILGALNFAMPSEKILLKYNNLSEIIIEQISMKTKENERLEKLRDTLLPKLMSGEIRVPLENSEN
ncbi:restriction endonuclease subunit S [Clostridium perfringens]|uniref:restriction endonuclease subunit S n=1 Tax=Clostridium perfringens TaxID=1502 RepID=UPI002247E33E|nr:restriction endonuclease subunit S [Clostridium perfringens]MCX0388862.1 restriction endonuclease subunit S [Clostridium perfringens]